MTRQVDDLARSVILDAMQRTLGRRPGMLFLNLYARGAQPTMMDGITNGIKAWLVKVFSRAIATTTRPEDRASAIQWLGQSRDVVASDLGSVEKFKRLNSLINSRATAIAIARNVSEAVTNYKTSSLPWSMKVALPATLAAIPIVGGQAAGIAAFGGAVGVPVLLLIFLGSAGITAIIESVVRHPETNRDIAKVINVIIDDERLRRASAELKTAMREQPMNAARVPMPPDELALRQHLYGMNPYHFEQHAMSFFTASGLEAWATRKSNDMGVDGFAIHPNGPIIVQCKRNSMDNRIGRPVVQQFKGVVEEQNAVSGYIITTSSFTKEARHSSQLSEKLFLIDMDELVHWHANPPDFL